MTDRRTASPFDQWRRKTAVALWSSLAVIAVVLVWRRLAGAFSVQSDALAACTFSTLAALVGVGACWLRVASVSRESTRPSRLEHFSAAAATLGPPLLVGIALFPRGSSVAAAYLTVLLLLAGAAVFLLGRFEPVVAEHADETHLAIAREVVPRAVLPPNQPSPDEETRQTESEKPDAGRAVRISSNGSAADGGVSQWFRRETLPDGVEQIEGSIRLSFAPGQKQAVMHLPFTPPLTGVPAIECEPLDSADVELKVAAAYTYGARIEARRQEPLAKSLEVEIGYTASAAREGAEH